MNKTRIRITLAIACPRCGNSPAFAKVQQTLDDGRQAKDPISCHRCGGAFPGHQWFQLDRSRGPESLSIIDATEGPTP